MFYAVCDKRQVCVCRWSKHMLPGALVPQTVTNRIPVPLRMGGCGDSFEKYEPIRHGYSSTMYYDFTPAQPPASTMTDFLCFNQGLLLRASCQCVLYQENCTLIPFPFYKHHQLWQYKWASTDTSIFTRAEFVLFRVRQSKCLKLHFWSSPFRLLK